MISKQIVELSKKVGIITGAVLGACACLAGVGAFLVWLHVKTVIEPNKAITVAQIAAQAEKDNLRYEAMSLKLEQVLTGVNVMTEVAAEGVYTKKQIDIMKQERDQRADLIEARVTRLEQGIATIDAKLGATTPKPRLR